MDVTHRTHPPVPTILSGDAVRQLMWRRSADELADWPHLAAALSAFELGREGRSVPPAAQGTPGLPAAPVGSRQSSLLGGVAGASRLLFLVASLGEQLRSGLPATVPGEGEPSEAHGPDADDLERLAETWAAAEAGSSLAFAAARALDGAGLRERLSEPALLARGIAHGSGRMSAWEQAADEAVEMVALAGLPASRRDHDRWFALQADQLVQWALADGLAGALAPASRVWAATRGVLAARDASSVLAPGALAAPATGALERRWLEQVPGEPVRAARRQLADAMTEPVFLALFRSWIVEMREIASRRPGTGACTVATAMQMWLWTLAHVSREDDAEGDRAEAVLFDPGALALADVLSWLLAARALVVDLVELAGRAPGHPSLGRDAGGVLPILTDLCHVETARVAGEVGRVSAELVCGMIRHPAWDAEGCGQCYQADDLEALEDLFPGLAASAGPHSDVVAADGSPPPKAGPCVRFTGIDTFTRLRGKLDGCLSGSRLARQRVARALG